VRRGGAPDGRLRRRPRLLKAGVAGTRIEDVVAVEKDGCEVLTQAPKGLFAEATV
jgi:Xaa-Pro aminopeptidase